MAIKRHLAEHSDENGQYHNHDVNSNQIYKRDIKIEEKIEMDKDKEKAKNEERKRKMAKESVREERGRMKRGWNFRERGGGGTRKSINLVPSNR